MPDAGASNTILLRAGARLAPADLGIALFDGFAERPHDSPDLEAAPPPIVVQFRQRIGRTVGLLIPSPEDAHGVPGALKNAPDGS